MQRNIDKMTIETQSKPKSNWKHRLGLFTLGTLATRAAKDMYDNYPNILPSLTNSSPQQGRSKQEKIKSLDLGHSKEVDLL